MKKLHRLLAATAVTAFTGLAGAQYAEPEVKTPTPAEMKAEIIKLADVIQASTNKYCKSEFDGDKSKGELANADVATLVRGMVDIPAQHPEIKLGAIHALVSTAAQSDYTPCFDSRVKELGDANVPEAAKQTVSGMALRGVLYPAFTTLSLLPTPLDTKSDPTANSTALLISFHRLATRSGQFEKAVHTAQMLEAMGDARAQRAATAALFIGNTPFLYFYNAAEPGHSVDGPAQSADQLMKNPILKPQPASDDSAPTAPARSNNDYII